MLNTDDDFDNLISELVAESKKEQEAWANCVQKNHYILCDRTQQYTFTRHTYLRKNRWYKIKHVNARSNGDTTVIVANSYNGENAWLQWHLTVDENLNVVWKPSWMTPKRCAKHINNLKKQLRKERKC